MKQGLITDGGRLGFVDAARGWAILGVLVVHASMWTPGLSAEAHEIMACGQYGVQLFFVISAFTLAMTWTERGSSQPPSRKGFWIRRAFRILPMYWTGILLYAALAFVLARGRWLGFDGQATLLHMFLLHGWSPTHINAVVPGGWSIGVEVAFYLLFPFVIRHLSTLNRALVALGLAVAFSFLLNGLGGLIVEGEWRSEIANNTFWYWWLPSQLPVFVLGLVAYRIWEGSAEGESAPHPLLAGCSILVLVTLGVLVSHMPGLAQLAAWLFGAAAAVFLLFLGISNAASRLLCLPSVQAVGRLSYSLYLLHFAVAAVLILWALPRMFPLSRLPGAINFGLVMTVLLATTLPLCMLCQQFIEQPGIRFGRRLSQRFRTAPEAAAVKPTAELKISL